MAHNSDRHSQEKGAETERPQAPLSSAQESERERAKQAIAGSPFLNTKQATAFLGVGPNYLKEQRRKKLGPVYRRHSRMVQYHVDDLIAWSNASAKHPVS